MSADRLGKIVDEFIDSLSAGSSLESLPDTRSLTGQERDELKICLDTARWIETAIADSSRERMTRSGIVSLAADDAGETLPAGRDKEGEEFAAGQTLGDFEIIREIGRGGMGIVFAARQKSLDRQVALKVLPPGVGWNKTVLERFLREARAVAQLEHGHIIPVYQIDKEKGAHYFAMQLIDGFPLSLLARASIIPDRDGPARGPAKGTPKEHWPEQIRPPSDPAYFRFAARAVSQAASGIDYAHQQGILHRDVKPSNLIVDKKGKVWIADFGLARLSTDPSVTMSGQLIGTLNYMSPEQAAGGGSVGPRSDIYGLGATLYELLTLRTPFTAKSTQDLLMSIQQEDPTPPSKVNPRVPVDLEVIALKAMDKDPERRYASAGEMGADLQRWLDDMPIRARRTSVWRLGYKWVRRKRILVSAAALIAVIVLTATWITRSATKQATQQTAQTEQKLEVAQQQRQAEGDVTTGQRLFEQQDFDAAQVKFTDAAEFFSKFLTGTDKFAEAISAPVRIGVESFPYVYLGLISLRDQTAEAYADAARHFDLALQLDPDNVLLKSLRVLAETQDYDLVQSVIRQVESLPRDRDWGPFAADAYYALARAAEYYDLPASIRLASMALDHRSGYLDALGFRGWLHYQVGQYEPAVNDLEFVSYLDKKPEYFVWLAKVHHALGEGSQARSRFRQAVELAPDSFMVRAEYLIWLAQDLGYPAQREDRTPGPLPEALIAALNPLESLSPIAFTDYYYLGLAYEVVARTSKATGAFQQALSTMPEGARGYLAGACLVRAARVALDAGETDRALGYYEQALEACPHREFFQDRGDVLAALGRWEHALSDYQEALRRGSTGIELRLSRAKAFGALGRLEESLEDLGAVLREEPAHWDALNLVAEIKLAQGDPSAAVSALTVLADTYQGDFRLLEKRARARLLAGEEAGARRDLVTAIEEGLPASSADSLLGRLWEGAGNDEKALQAYDRALSQKGDQRAPRWSRIKIFVRGGRMKDALLECDKALEVLTNDTELLITRAEVCERMGNEAAAIEDLRRVLALRPNEDRARWRLAQLLFYAKDLSVRDPAAVEGLLARPSDAEDEASQTDHRILGHLRFHQGRYAESAAEMNQLKELKAADWLVLAGLRAQGYVVAGAEDKPKAPPRIKVTLPAWLEDLSKPIGATQRSDQATGSRSSQSEPEQ